MCGVDSHDSGHEPKAGFCERDNERLDFIKGIKFLYWLSDYKLLKNGLCSMALVNSCLISYVVR
jgi:hypothetical protein